MKIKDIYIAINKHVVHLNGVQRLLEAEEQLNHVSLLEQARYTTAYDATTRADLVGVFNLVIKQYNKLAGEFGAYDPNDELIDQIELVYELGSGVGHSTDWLSRKLIELDQMREAFNATLTDMGITFTKGGSQEIIEEEIEDVLENPYYEPELIAARLNASWNTYTRAGAYHHWFEIKKTDLKGRPIMPKLFMVRSEAVSPWYAQAKHPLATFIANAGPSSYTFISDGKIIYDRDDGPQRGLKSDIHGVMAIMKDNTARWYAKETPARQMIQDGVLHATSTFNPLMINGAKFDWYKGSGLVPDVGDIFQKKHPRMLLVEKEDSWIFIHVIGRMKDSLGMNYEEMYQWIKSESGQNESRTFDSSTVWNSGKVINVFNLDGGGSSFFAPGNKNIAPVLDRFGRTGRRLNGMIYIEKPEAANYPLQPTVANFMADSISPFKPEQYGGFEHGRYIDGEGNVK